MVLIYQKLNIAVASQVSGDHTFPLACRDSIQKRALT